MWRELEREREARAPLRRRWLVAALLAGAALTLALGFGTDLFERGPTEADVDAAFRRGAEDGAAATEADWRAELERRELVGFARGRSASSQVSAESIDRFRHGFTYEAAYDAALALAEEELAEAWDEGWRNGYRAAWVRISGSPPNEAPENPPNAPPSGARNGSAGDPANDAPGDTHNDAPEDVPADTRVNAPDDTPSSTRSDTAGGAPDDTRNDAAPSQP